MTRGKPVIMGRKTFESMGSKPLPDRVNIILTTQSDWSAPNCQVVHSTEGAIAVAGSAEEIMVIGGAKIYEAFLPLVSRLYLTIVQGNYVGDTHFPALDWKQWQKISEEKWDGFTTQIFEKGV